MKVTEDLIPITWSLDAGTRPDSLILDKLLQKQRKLPYEMYLNKVYEF